MSQLPHLQNHDDNHACLTDLQWELSRAGTCWQKQCDLPFTLTAFSTHCTTGVKWRHSIWLIAWCQFNSLLMFSWLWQPNILHLLSSPNKFFQLFYLNGSDYLDLAYIRLLLTCYLELVIWLCCHPGAAVCFMSLIYRHHVYQHAKVVHMTAYFSWSACILFLI